MNKNVNEQTNVRDAVNLATVDAKVKRCLKLNANRYMYKDDGKKINNRGSPQVYSDCET